MGGTDACAFQTAEALKREWCEVPVTNDDVITFGELLMGDRFIFMPIPGRQGKASNLRKPQQVFIRDFDQSQLDSGVCRFVNTMERKVVAKTTPVIRLIL